MGKRLEYTLEAVNERLRAAKSKARLYQREEMLWLQATLPSKPGNFRIKPYQQRISLGVPATEDGFKRAEQEANLFVRQNETPGTGYILAKNCKSWLTMWV